jgi:hypothetical protein
MKKNSKFFTGRPISEHKKNGLYWVDLNVKQK